MKKITTSLLLILISLATAVSTYAARTDVGGLDPGERFGGGGRSITLNLIIDRFINFAIGSAATVFLLMFVWGSFTWLTSQGDKAAVESAKGKITSGLIGLIIVASSFAVYLIVKEITFSTTPTP